MKAMAPSFTFVGRAFLSTDAAELGRMIRALRNVVQPMGPLAAHLERMERALESAPDELKKEHIRLFLNPEGAPCPPWQSAYDEEPQMMGPSHRSALGWYRALGFEPKNASEPADHVGLLLAFYGTLVELDAAAEFAPPTMKNTSRGCRHFWNWSKWKPGMSSTGNWPRRPWD